MRHIIDVVHPVCVDRAERDDALGTSNGVGIVDFALLFVEFLRKLLEFCGEFVAVCDFGEMLLRNLIREVKVHGAHALGNLVEVP